MSRRALSGGFVLLMLLASASHAAQGRRMARRTVLTNQALEKAYTEILLLNILRARDRRPMFFTTLPSTTSTMVRGPGFTFKGPIGNGSNGPGEGSISFGLGNTTQVQSQNLTTQEFMNGIMTPMKPELLAYYLEQGWPADFILHMALLSFDGKDNHPKACVENCAKQAGAYCMARADYDAFSTALYGKLNASNQKARIRDAGAPVPVGPLLTTAADSAPLGGELLASLSALPALKLRLLRCTSGTGTGCSPTGFRLVTWKPRWELEFPSAEAQHSRDYVDPCKGLDPCPTTDGQSAPEPPPERSKTSHYIMVQQIPDPADVLPKTDPSRREVPFHVRSPEAMLYYLGQIARQTTSPRRSGKHSTIPRIRSSGSMEGGRETEPLFRLLPDDGKCEADIRVRYDGRHYIVPRLRDADSGEACDPGSTMRALSFLTQLFMLQQSAKDQPQAVTINVANP